MFILDIGPNLLSLGRLTALLVTFAYLVVRWWEVATIRRDR